MIIQRIDNLKYSFLRPDQGHDKERTNTQEKCIPLTSTQIKTFNEDKNKKWRESISSNANEEITSQSSSNPEYVINPKP
jgi:hypothetical protein